MPSERPLLVLLHGGATTGRQWDLVREQLAGPALAPSAPGRLDRPGDLGSLTLEDAVSSLGDDVDGATGGEVVLAAHSSGGLFVAGLAARLGARLRGVVWIAASIPLDGGQGLDCMQPRHRDAVLAAHAEAQRSGRALLTPPPPAAEHVRGAYGGPPLTDEQIAFCVHPDRWVQDTMGWYFTPIATGVLRDLPRLYVRTLRDRALPVALQEEMVARLPGTPTIPLDTGHVPMVTAPQVVAALLDGFAADQGR